MRSSHVRQITNQKSAIENFWRGSLTGKAVVLKTTALVACRFESCPLRQSNFEFRFLIFDLVFDVSLRLVLKIKNQKSKNHKSQINNTLGLVAQWNESATLRRSRSHVQIVPSPPKNFGFRNADFGFRVCRIARQREFRIVDKTKSAIRSPKSEMFLPV